MWASPPPLEVGVAHPGRIKVCETFELNQLKSAPSQLLPVFQHFTGRNHVAINLDRPISFFIFSSPG